MRAAIVLLVACVARGGDTDLRAFIGTWKENQAKSRHVLPSVLTYTFTADPDGFLTIVRGQMLRDRIRMDGKDYPRPSIPGETLSWTKMSDTVYESTMKRDGVIMGTATWTVSGGRKHLTQETIPVRANSDNDKNTIEYIRSSGAGDSVLGEWKPVSTRSAVPDLFVISLADEELRVFYPKYGKTIFTMRLDGKKYPYTGLSTLAGTTSVAEALGVRSLRRTQFSGEKSTFEMTMAVSLDSNTLTVTTQTPNSADEPSVIVYEKQD